MLLLKNKLLIINFVFYFLLLNITFINFKERNIHLINEKNTYLKKYLILKKKPLNDNDALILKEKRNIYKFISRTIRKKITSIKKIIFVKGTKFGNNLLCLNKLIFFCEIIGCNEIDLTSEKFWFIKNQIFLKDYNITIKKINVNESYKRKKCQNDSNTIYYDSFNIFTYFYKIKPEIRIHLLRDEIIKNLPILNISREDLYIHLRGGDIFKSYIHKPYAQPPLCFYTNIIKNFNFNKIFIVSEDKNNPIYNKLISKFNNIIYSINKNSLQYDLSCLMNSYNLVGSISSFLNVIIILNYNLENLWNYNIYQMNQKIRHFHYDLYEFPHSFTIYQMEASKNYKNKMYFWKNSRLQRKLMIKEKCINTFMIIRNQ